MATMNFSIPDDVKDAFNRAFEGENKSAVIARLMRGPSKRRTAIGARRDWSSGSAKSGPTAAPDDGRRDKARARGIEKMKLVVDANSG